MPPDKTDVEELLRTLLFEGYALYPYTPGATKNATPTPFGIVYPPVYAAEGPATYDRLQMSGVVIELTDATTLAASIVFLEPAGERHEGVERRLELPATDLRALIDAPVVQGFAFEAVCGRVAMVAETLPCDDALRVRITVDNETEVGPGLSRQEGLRSSLMSTHVVARLHGGARFSSPIEPYEEHAAAVMTSAQVNTFPVLAADDDTALLGAAIVLPDHPQIAPESSGDLFDASEIEEALRLHLLALSDGEIDELAEQDPQVREMVERAIRTAPEDIVRLHGRVEVGPARPGPAQTEDEGQAAVLAARAEVFGAPREDPEAGEDHAVVDGVLYARGLKVVLRPEAGRGGQDHLLDGKDATVERVYVDIDHHVHLGVTVDDDPGQELMRDIGRYLYFKPAEVEVVSS